MDSILSVNMSYSEQMCALAEWWTMTVDPSESNITCCKNYTIEEIMWNIQSFEKFHKKKGMFLVWSLGGLFLAFQLGLIEFVLSLLDTNVCLTKSFVENCIHIILNLSSLKSLCKIIPPNIRIIYEAKKRLVQDTSGGFIHFCKINVYLLECFGCVYHELLSVISLTLLPSRRYFTVSIIIVHRPFTW